MALIVTGLLLPGALGATVTGDFSAAFIRIPAENHLEGRALAAFATGNLAGSSLEIKAGRLHVVEHEREYVVLGNAELSALPPKEIHHNFTNAVLSTQDADPLALVGLYPEDAALMAVQSRGGITYEARQASTLSDRTESAPVDDRWWYHEEIVEAHGLVAASGTATLRGPADVKLRGFLVTVASATDQAVLDVRSERSPTSMTVRWLVVSSQDVDATFETGPAELHAAFAESTATWSGTSTLGGAAGHLRADGIEYEATRETATITGDLTARISPFAERGQARIRLSFDGDMRATSLTGTLIQAQTNSGATAALSLLMIGAVLVVGGATAAIHRVHRRRKASRSAPTVGFVQLAEPSAITRPVVLDLVDRARELGDAGQWAESAAAFERARNERDTLRGLALEEGLARHMAGDHVRAIEVFALAAREEPDGEAQVYAAWCAVEIGDDRRAAEFLAAALEAPGLSLDVLRLVLEENPARRIWMNHPRLKDAMARVALEYSITM